MVFLFFFIFFLFVFVCFFYRMTVDGSTILLIIFVSDSPLNSFSYMYLCLYILLQQIYLIEMFHH